MWDFSPNPGRLLREFRLRRELTLRSAAPLLHTSAPVLSRKERGIVAIDRLDVQSAIEGYQLDAWESFILWTATGLLPTPTSPSIKSDYLRKRAEGIITTILEPAFLADEFLYVRAWNAGIQLLWRLDGQTDPIHLVDVLFSDAMRLQTGAQWESFCVRTLRLFRQMTQSTAQDADLRQLLARFEAQYGQQFVERWNRAAGAVDGTGEELEPLLLQIASEVGPIDYLLVQAAYTTFSPWLLCIYLPYGDGYRASYNRLISGHLGSSGYHDGAQHTDGAGAPEPV